MGPYAGHPLSFPSTPVLAHASCLQDRAAVPRGTRNELHTAMSCARGELVVSRTRRAFLELRDTEPYRAPSVRTRSRRVGTGISIETS